MTSTTTRRSFLRQTAALAAWGGAALAAGCSDEGNGAADVEPTADAAGTSAETGGTDVLVAYFSATGNTEEAALAIADELGADIFTITPAQPYTADDLDYRDDASRVSVEHADDARHTELAAVTPEGFDTYGTVLLGYPIWWQEASWVVEDFVTGNDFTGKRVIPFCTSASSPLGQSGQRLAELAGTGDWLEGERFSSAAPEDETRSWARGLEL